MDHKKLVIFASGSGTNAAAIATYFDRHASIHVSAIYSNKPDAYVLERAKKLAISTTVFSRSAFDSNSFLDLLQGVDYIILAGFLWKIPSWLVAAFPEKILNIHPSLLPKFGGKGMYGAHVHRAVLQAKEKVSGITIHLVNEVYDEGEILFQATCSIAADETPDSLAAKVHQLEHKHYPEVIERYIMSGL